MDGKNALVVVLVAVVAILAKGTWDRTAAGTPGASNGAPAAGGAAATQRPATGPAAAGAPDPKAPAGASAPAACDRKAACASAPDLLCQLECDFPGVAPAKPAAAGSPRPGAPRVHVLLASLPSPLEPALVNDFDRGVEAIDRAVQSQRYVPQRRWLPAREKGPGKPGWMVFRRDQQDEADKNRKVTLELLLVLVVGERPDSGVDRAELHGALTLLQEIATEVPTASATNVALLGPTYSGAAESLVQQTRAWCDGRKEGSDDFCRKRTFLALSGTATRPRTKAIIEGLGDVFKQSQFAATVLPDNLLVSGMHRFIMQRLQVEKERIADLTETSTDYGNAVAIERPGAPGIKIGLPLNLAQLAQAPPDPKGETGPLAKSKGMELTSTFATLSRKGIDHVGILVTATSEKVFLVSRLREAAPDLRVYVYESSLELADPAKRKSLEGLMVASSYPVFAETQLWSKAAAAAPLVQFPSDAAQGIYNAVLGLLSRFDKDLKSSLPGKLLDYVSPFCQDVPGPSVWVSASISGQLWPLAVYSQALADDSKVETCEQAKTKPIDPYLFDPRPGVSAPKPVLPVHASFPVMIGAVFVLVLMVGNAIGFTRKRPNATWRRFLVSYDPSDEKSPPPPFAEDGPRHSVAMLGLWTLALTAFVMGKVLGLPATLAASTADHTLLRILSLLLVWGSFGLVFTACVLAFQRRQGGKDEDAQRQRQASALIQAVMCALLLAAILILPFKSVLHPDGHAYFFFVRATDPGIGLAPTLPLFMVGMTIYGAALLRLIVVRRADRLEKEAMNWNPETGEPPPDKEPRSLSTCAEAMMEFAEASSRSLLPACIAGTLVGTVVLYLTPMRLGSLEGRRFDLGCSVCFALIFTLTLAAAWRAHSLWFRLRDFTRALAIHPASAALARLPSSVAERFRSPVPGQVGNQQIDVALAMTAQALAKTPAPAVSTLVTTLHDRWFPVAAGKKPEPPAAPGSAPPPLHKRSAEELQEDLLALRMANTLGLMCDATRTMLFVATGTGLAALLGCALYPFQPAASLAAAGLLSVGLVVVVALRVLLGIERDKVLSDVAGTTPGKVTPSLGLFTRLVGYVVVPLGGLIGARMQDSGSVIELLKSLTNALNR